jgi:hypothetical protein
LQQEKNSHAWQKKGENVTLEGLILSLLLCLLSISSLPYPAPLLSCRQLEGRDHPTLQRISTSS